MYEEDTHSVIIDIPKPRNLFEESSSYIKQKVIKQVPKSQSSKKQIDANFSLPDIKPLSIANFKKEGVLLPYMLYSRKQEKDKVKRRCKLGFREQYKADYADLQKRLYTEDPADDVHAVTDFDPGFFKCVNGTFLSSYVAPFKSLKYLFNSQLGWRQEVGYRHDCMLNMDINFKNEQEIYNLSVKKYMEQVKYFDEFVSDDYRKSMTCLSKWDEVKLALYKQNFDLQCMATKIFNISSSIVGLDYRYGLQQKYGRFLYYLSPPSWRFKNRNFARSIEIEARGFDFGISSEEDTFNVMFEKLKKECYSGLIKPVLFFHHPADIMQIFDGIEQQHLHHFTHVVALAPHSKHLKKGIKLFKDIIALESAGILNVIKQFKNLLQLSEDQRSQLEAKFFKIINGLFYESVGALDVLKLKTHLEFCYEKVYNEKPINMDIVSTAKALEDVYMDYSRRLDAVTGDKIQAAMAQYVKSEKKKFRRAKVAARELRQFERLERALLRAHAPIASNASSYRYIVNRSSQRKLFPKLKYDGNTLTEAELEYLTLFTDWTGKEDPAQFIQGLQEHT
ncbi:uncharacterized protein LOC113496460 [Trichoplusia ni]|uniref:Uncharacterized protein LOC113496460 n=1 Tax=Trichoplusia ni TaxID=7111 RepID=A0A7E5VT22_TRINI|nr:uncharacterized protein LOC113496460 [Trichoplusia ni]